MTMNPFSGLKTAKMFDNGEYLEPGEYEAQLTDVLWKKVEEGYNALIVEFTLLSSTNEKHPAGKKRSWFQKENKSFTSAALEFVVAACGYDRKDPKDKEIIDAKIQPVADDILLKAVTSGVLRGRKVRIVVTHKLTKENKKDFHRYAWAPADAKLPFS